MAGPFYVDVALGNDANAGTSEGAGNAWASIGKALQTVAAGEIVYVKASGDYVAQDGATGAIGAVVTPGTSGSRIEVIGYTLTITDGGDVTLDAGTNGLTSCLNSALGANTYYTFKNFILTGASSHGADLGVENRNIFIGGGSNNNSGAGYSLGSSCIVQCAQINNNTLDGIASGSDVTTIGNVFFSNSDDAIQAPGSATIVGNVFYDQTDDIIVLTGANNAVLNNTFDGGGTAGSKAINFSSTNAVSSVVMNNIFLDCETDIVGNSTTVNALSLNNMFYPTKTLTGWPADASDLVADPLFTDASANDYTLQSTSPALAAGIDAGEVVNGESFIDLGAQQKAASATDYPSEDDVRFGTSFDTGGQTGNMTLPAVGDVETAVQFGTSGTEFTGTFDSPAETDVEDGVGYGAAGTEFEGNVTLPVEANVKYLIQYGANGTEFTGSLNTPPVAADTAEENLQTILSNCTNWQTETGTDTAASAAGFIGIGYDPKGSGFRAVIGEDTGAATAPAGTGGSMSGGTIDLGIYEDIGSSETESGAITTFKSKVANIMQEMQQLQGPYLVIQRTTAQGPPMRTRAERGDSTDVFQVKYDVEHGVDSI